MHCEDGYIRNENPSDTQKYQKFCDKVTIENCIEYAWTSQYIECAACTQGFHKK